MLTEFLVMRVSMDGSSSKLIYNRNLFVPRISTYFSSQERKVYVSAPKKLTVINLNSNSNRLHSRTHFEVVALSASIMINRDRDDKTDAIFFR